MTFLCSTPVRRASWRTAALAAVLSAALPAAGAGPAVAQGRIDAPAHPAPDGGPASASPAPAHARVAPRPHAAPGGAHVIWLGPVSRAQRAGATVQGAEEHFVSCTGDGSGGTARCRALAEGLADADGRHLPGLLRRLGVPEGEELYLGAFSAGGAAVKVILAHAADRAAIRVVMLADATYELRGADGSPAASPSLVAYAAEALRDGSRMLVATGSAAPNLVGGTAQPSGSQTLERLARAIGERAGEQLRRVSVIEGAGELRPARVWGQGSVVLADFAGQFSHPEHATLLAPILWREVMEPWANLPDPTPLRRAPGVLGPEPIAIVTATPRSMSPSDFASSPR